MKQLEEATYRSNQHTSTCQSGDILEARGQTVDIRDGRISEPCQTHPSFLMSQTL